MIVSIFMLFDKVAEKILAFFLLATINIVLFAKRENGQRKRDAPKTRKKKKKSNKIFFTN